MIKYKLNLAWLHSSKTLGNISLKQMYAKETRAMLPQETLVGYNVMGNDDQLEVIMVLTKEDQVGGAI